MTADTGPTARLVQRHLDALGEGALLHRRIRDLTTQREDLRTALEDVMADLAARDLATELRLRIAHLLETT